MNQQYDNQATSYNGTATQNPFVLKVIRPSVFKAIGELHEKNVLDIACGAGDFAIHMKQLGAHKVIGVDISSGMIELAVSAAKLSGNDVEFIVEDAEKLGKLGDFDIVTALFLFQYAPSRESLLRMVQNIRKNLKPNGKFVGTVSNDSLKDSSHAEKFGFKYSAWMEGEWHQRQLTGTQNGQSFTVSFYAIKPETYERAFKEAGFEHFEWFKLSLYTNASEEERQEYHDIVEKPTVLGMQAW